MEQVILVDEQDRKVGVAEKLRAHQDGGQLHRAFSIFIFNRRGELLLQKRATGKYHFGGLWSNACCGHPRPGERLLAAARRRLGEEFGFETELTEKLAFTYEALDTVSGLTEREYLHVVVGHFDGEPAPAISEIEAWRWETPASIRREIEAAPQRFTPWLPIASERLTRLHHETW